MAIEKDVLDQLLAGRDPKDVFNKDGLVDELKKALSERILNTELDEHLDGEGTKGRGNHRNGYSKKSVLTGTSKMTLSVPRDRAGTRRALVLFTFTARHGRSNVQTKLFILLIPHGAANAQNVSRQLLRRASNIGADNCVPSHPR